jgi:hypothetical protein
MCTFRTFTAAVKFGIKFGKSAKIIQHKNISPRKFNTILDEVNNAYILSTKPAVQTTSRSLTIFPTSYLSASTGGLEKNPVQLPLDKTYTRIFIMSAITLVT